jgi:hypothetical protein
MMVQRALAAKSLSHAQGGTLLAGYIKILPLFMMVMPGMISRALYPGTKNQFIFYYYFLYLNSDFSRFINHKDTVGCADPDTCMKVCDSKNGCSNIAYPMLIMTLMPVGKFLM